MWTAVNMVAEAGVSSAKRCRKDTQLPDSVTGQPKRDCFFTIGEEFAVFSVFGCTLPCPSVAQEQFWVRKSGENADSVVFMVLGLKMGQAAAIMRAFLFRTRVVRWKPTTFFPAFFGVPC